MRTLDVNVTQAPARAVAAHGRRRADLAWLRVGGMALVFTLHAAEPFNPWDRWHIQSPVQSKLLGELVFVLAPWVMPLFMALAGEGAWHALGRRTPGRYVRERLLRIGLPLVAGLLVLVPPQVWIERRFRGEFAGSLLAFYPRFFDGLYPEGNFSWHHLWFLAFLLVFAVVTVPLFVWLRGPAGRWRVARFAAPCAAAGGLAWLLLPAVVVRLALSLSLARFPPLAYDWSNRGLLLPAFVAGYLLAGEPALRRAVDRHWRTALVLALAASAALGAWAWPGDVLARLPPPRSLAGVALSAGYACAAWSWLVALRGGAHRLAGWTSAPLERASELVYPFYALHHGMVIAVAAAVVAGARHPLGAFLEVAAASLALTLALCGLVSIAGPLRLAFGLPRRPRPVA